MKLPTTVDPRTPEFRINAAQMRALIEELRTKRAQAAEHSGRPPAAGVAGKLMPRERVMTLLDPGAPFLELSPLAGHGLYGDAPAGAGLVTGIGRIEGRECMVIANDPSFAGGAYLPMTVKKQLRAQDIAGENRLPCLYLAEAGGPSLPCQADVFADEAHFGRILFNQARLSARGIPQIAVMFGERLGAGMPVIADETLSVRSTVWRDGRATAEGDDAVDDAHALARCRRTVANLAKRRPDILLRAPCEPAYNPADLDGIVPVDLAKPYDVCEVIARLVDASEFEAFKPRQGMTLVTGFAHIHGIPLGVLANNGVLDSEALAKASHFIALACQRCIPLLFLQNIAACDLGSGETAGIAKMLAAVACAAVPKITVIIGAAYGVGHYAMCGRAFDPRFLFTWPNARISLVSGDEAADALAAIERRAIEEKRGKWSEVEEEELKQPIREQYDEEGNPYFATARMWDDGIIAPQETRRVLALAFAATLNAPVEETKVGATGM
jgi:3-methylcrotonyl-CoA carboxylase beta subunit